MEENKVMKEDATKPVAAQDTENKTIPDAPTYDPDEYMKKYYLDGSIFYYDEKCLSCKYWLGYDCCAPKGPCNYESF